MNAVGLWTRVFPFDFEEVQEVLVDLAALVVLAANKVDEIHLEVDQKQPHAERVMQFIFLHIEHCTQHVRKSVYRNPCK